MEGEEIGLVLARASDLRSRISACVAAAGAREPPESEGVEAVKRLGAVGEEYGGEEAEEEEEVESLVGISDALESLERQLASLQGGNNIHSKGVSAIAETLKDNSVVTTLELSYNPIGPEGVKALCDVLKFNGKIQTLKLGWCQIGVSGAEFVADCLKYNTTLSTLDLRANGLGDDGAICLARSFKIINESLTSLDLGFNEIRDDGAFALAQALKANEDLAVTSLNLANNFFTKFGQVALSEARDHVYEMSEKEIDIYF